MAYKGKGLNFSTCSSTSHKTDFAGSDMEQYKVAAGYKVWSRINSYTCWVFKLVEKTAELRSLQVVGENHIR